MSKSGIVLFAHGARDPEWARPFARIRSLLEQRSPTTPVELAFLESMRPNLAEAMGALADRGAERVTIVPLFMAQGNHLRKDFPEVVRRASEMNPGLSVRVAPAIGDVDALLDAIAQWILREEAVTRNADLGHPQA
jgi:sirohydrochlorin cobaltochelatase